MLNWKRTGRVARDDGSGVTTYTAKGKKREYIIESRKNAIEHVGRSGVWYHTKFYLFAGTIEREFSTLKMCKHFAEVIEGQE